MEQNSSKNSYCRLCLNVDNPLECVYDNKRGSNICNYIQHFFAVQIHKNDKYSTSICQTCLDFIILICQKRLLYRENDAHIRSDNLKNKKKVPGSNHIEQNDQSVSCHRSVSDLMNKYDNVIIPKEYWEMNFDCTLKLTRVSLQRVVPVDLPTKRNDRLRKRLKSNPVSKYMRDPSYFVKCLKYGGDDSSSDNEENMKYSPSTKRMKRSNKQPSIFGNPIFYDQCDIDMLDEICSEDSKRESYTENSLSNYACILNQNTSGENKHKYKRQSFKKVHRLKIYKKNMQRLSSNFTCPFQERRFSSTPRLMDKRCAESIIHCSEESWNNFFKSYYEYPEDPKTFDCDVFNGETFPLQLSLLQNGAEHQVYLCPLCDMVFDSDSLLQSHIMSHQNNPINELYQNFVNCYVTNSDIPERDSLLC